MSVPFTAIGPVVSTGDGEWTTEEKAQIRYRLGIDGDSDVPTATPSPVVLDSASVTAIRDGIPKVGETHRYTQVDSGATTTDVSIGEAT